DGTPYPRRQSPAARCEKCVLHTWRDFAWATEPHTHRIPTHILRGEVCVCVFFPLCTKLVLRKQHTALITGETHGTRGTLVNKKDSITPSYHTLLHRCTKGDMTPLYTPDGIFTVRAPLCSSTASRAADPGGRI
uniref:Uncharacterized protein n=1 Tax=Scleropages formosus TaxID=113540 RepID=A0A8C9V0C1_SCLFO